MMAEGTAELPVGQPPAGRSRTTFSSLAVRNFRLYLFGQIVSFSGTWMQAVAMAWLVLRLTGSGTALGVVIALQFLPVLLLGSFGGVIADRFPKRRLLFWTQAASGLLALALGVLVTTGSVRLWMVYVVATGFGLVNAIDMPSRQTFIMEMVGRENVTSAISLSSAMVSLARVVGPAVAGALIQTTSIAVCFYANAGSYVAVIAALLLMRTSELWATPPQVRAKGQLREGLRYVRGTPELLVPLVVIAVIGTLTWEFQVSLPLLARFTFHRDAGTYGLMSTCMGIGAVMGGLAVASRDRHAPVALAHVSVAFGALTLAVAVAPSLTLVLVLLVPLGAASMAFIAVGNTTLQLAAAPAMRGRVMALWTVAFVGSNAVGGPLIGWIGQHLGPRYGLGIGGVSCLLTAIWSYRRLLAIGRRPPPLVPVEITTGVEAIPAG